MTTFIVHHIVISIAGAFIFVNVSALLIAWWLGHLEPVE